MDELNVRCAEVSLADDDWEDEEGLIGEEEDLVRPDALGGSFLLAKVITDKPIQSMAFQNVMKGIWRLVKGIKIKQLQPCLFSIQVFHDLDCDRLMNEGPWLFDMQLVVISRLGLGVSPTSVPMHLTEFWIRVFDVAECFWSIGMATKNGNVLGTFLRTDDNTFSGDWRLYMRVRVLVDITKPLKKKYFGQAFFILGGGFWQFPNPPRAMSLISWNCCGLGPTATVQELKDLVARVRPILIFLSEVRCSRERIEHLSKELGFQRSFTVRSDTTGGGLALIWDSNADVTLRSYNIFHIDVDVRFGGKLWSFTGFYGHPRRQLRHLSWNLLRRLAGRQREAWVLLGDFNEILHVEEQWGGEPHPTQLISDFQAALQDSRLSDLGFVGCPFTWIRTRDGSVIIRERLDRGLADEHWHFLFPRYALHHETMASSDHEAIVLKLDRQNHRESPGFKFSNEWRLQAM